jgi:hypothetical protein
MAALSSDPASNMAFSSSQSGGGDFESSLHQEMIGSQEETGIGQDEAEILLLEPAAERFNVSRKEEVQAVALDRPSFLPSLLKRQVSSTTSVNESSSLPTTESVIKSFSSTPGYLANRWSSINSSISTPASSQKPAFCTPPL